MNHRLRFAAFMLLAAAAPLAAPAQPQLPDDRRLRLERIEVEPDRPGVRDLVLGDLRLRPGDPIDDATLLRWRERLEDSREYTEVDVYTSRGSQPGWLILHVAVSLDERLRLLTGLGFDPLDSWYLNLVGGRLRHWPAPGSEISLALRDGVFTSGVYLESRFPVRGRPGAAWLFEASVSDQSWFLYDGRDAWYQSISHVSLRAGRRAPVGSRATAVAWLGSSWERPGDEAESWMRDEDLRRPAAELVPADLADREQVHLDLELSRGRRDGRPTWRTGAWAMARARAARVVSHGGGYWTLEAGARRAMPLSDQASLSGRLRLGHAGPGTPYYQRFQVGGVLSNRGFEHGRLSGPAGAADTWQASVELRTALVDRSAPLPKVTGVIFVDTSQAWDQQGHDLGFATGVGYGLRVRLPWVQIIGLDIGYPIVEPGDGAPFVAHASLGWLY